MRAATREIPDEVKSSFRKKSVFIYLFIFLFVRRAEEEAIGKNNLINAPRADKSFLRAGAVVAVVISSRRGFRESETNLVYRF